MKTKYLGVVAKIWKIFICDIFHFCPFLLTYSSIARVKNELGRGSEVRGRLGRPQERVQPRRPAFFAGSSGQELDPQRPQVSATLPPGSRVSSGRGRIPASRVGCPAFLEVLLSSWAPDSLRLLQSQSFLWGLLLAVGLRFLLAYRQIPITVLAVFKGQLSLTLL